VLYQRPAVFLGLAACLLASLTACASVPSSKDLQSAFAADPRLKNDSLSLDGSGTSVARSSVSSLQLPTDFPSEIPRYPNSRLQQVARPELQGAPSVPGSGTLTRWVSSDPANIVESFYRRQFQTSNWQVSHQPTDEQGGTFEARKSGLQVMVSIQPRRGASIAPSTGQIAAGSRSDVATEFTIQYARNASAAAPIQEVAKTAARPGDPSFIGPVMPPDLAAQSDRKADSVNAPVSSSDLQSFTDLDRVMPQEFRKYVSDLAGLGVLQVGSADVKSDKTAAGNRFDPSKTVSRREYARWLLAANNQLYFNNPAKQIRQITDTNQPAFQDVQRNDPDFAVIQGLAEAGLIPSPLSGDATAVLFRPDAPLTREQMILWKVPLDTRQVLPNASVDAVKQTWGFQDAARIDPLALRAVLADFQNRDQSNIRRVFGYTTLFQPQKAVTRAEAAAALWYFGSQNDGMSASDVLKLKDRQGQPSTTPVPTPSTAPQ
jgi:hypothetical protein